jgi:CDP-diacylglycerol--glycerol-3-phosphate 3-phosphatidyltransferase
MTTTGLKPRFQALWRPLTRVLHAAGATANQVTVATCLVSIAVGIGLLLLPGEPLLFLLVPAWMFVRMGFNAIDGMLAREFGQKSTLGAYLNELTDVVADALLYLPFAFLPGSSLALVGSVIALGIAAEMAGVMGPMVGASRRYDGPMGKGERALVFGLLGLLVGLGVPLAEHFAWIFPAVSVLAGITIVNRVRRGVAEAGR